MSEDNTVRYKVKVNNFEFNFSREELDDVDLVQKSDSSFHLLHEHRSVNGRLTAADPTAKKQTIEIGGDVFDIEIKDQLDQTLDLMGFNTVAARQVKEIKAPMPGLVLEIAVQEGQQVFAGDKILILVAMKMENAILIQADATIKRITVKRGEAVEKGQVMVEME